MPWKIAILQEPETGRVVVQRLLVADTFWQQARGLIGRSSLEDGEALCLKSCNAIHTFGMRFEIDVLFLDKKGYALKKFSCVKPWRICGPVWGACTVVEMGAGVLKRQNIQVGKRYLCVDQGTK